MGRFGRVSDFLFYKTIIFSYFRFFFSNDFQNLIELDTSADHHERKKDREKQKEKGSEEKGFLKRKCLSRNGLFRKAWIRTRVDMERSVDHLKNKKVFVEKGCAFFPRFRHVEKRYSELNLD
jgi:hypothetical protein